MFEQSVIPVGAMRKPWILPLVAIGQLLAVGAMVVIPMLSVQPLPVPELTTILVAPPPPPPPPPPPSAVRASARVPDAPVHKMLLRRFDAHLLIQPRAVPSKLPPVQDLPPAAPVVDAAGGIPGGVPGGQVGGQIGGVLGGIVNAVPSISLPPPPPPVVAQTPPKPAPPSQIRVGGAVQAARLVSSPQPLYPHLAAIARVEGTVVLDAVIGKDGHIKNLKVASGSPLLANAAIDAVKQWVYRPTYLNGRPVEVATEVDVRFQLS